MVADLRDRLVAEGMSIELTDAARDLVAKQGADPVYGARPLRRAIQTLIEDPLSEELLQGLWHAGEIIRVDEKDGALVFEHTTGEIPAPRRRESMASPDLIGSLPEPSRGSAGAGGLLTAGE